MSRWTSRWSSRWGVDSNLIFASGQILTSKDQNTPTRARLGTRQRTRKSRDCSHTHATSNARRDNWRDEQRDVRRKCNSFDNDRVAYRARARCRAGMFW